MQILILDSGQGLLGPVIQSLQKVPDLSVNVLTRSSDRSLRHSRFVESVTVWPQEGPDKDLDVLGLVIRETSAQVLLPIDEPALAFAAGNRSSLERMASLVPLPAPDVLETAGDKWLLSKLMAEKGIPQPTTLNLPEATPEQLAQFPFPALIKKSRGSGGDGIVTFESRWELEKFLAGDDGDPGGYILQEMLAGGEVDCSLLARDGEILAHTIQRPLLPKNGFDFARAVEFVHDQEALELARRLISGLNYSGIAHVDMIRDHRSGKLGILEINPRFWGSLVGSNATGVNFTLLALKAGLGQPLPETGFREIRYATAREAARLLLASLGKRNGPRIPWSQTNLKYYLADPKPLAAKGFRKVLGRFGSSRS